MPEPGMGANNDHGSSSAGNSFGGAGGGVGNNDTNASANDTTADSISNSNTTADNLSSESSDSDSPTTAESLASSPTTADTLSDTPTHSYDEVPSVAVSLDVSTDTPEESTTSATKGPEPETAPQLPDGVPEEYAELFGVAPKPTGGVDAVWANGDGTYSSSDGSTYNPATREGTYDPGEDSFAVTRSSTGITLDGDIVTTTERSSHPDRVRTSESLALVQHDPHNVAKAYGNRFAFDQYNNPNMDSIRDVALMQVAAATNQPIAGRYPGENMAYFGVVPPTAHLARSMRFARRTQQELISQLPPRTKITASDVVNITRRRDASLAWLETGNNRAGLAHITSRHGDDFVASGIPRVQIPNAVSTAVETGRVVGYQGKGAGRPVVEYEFNGATHRMAVTVSNNGFIVGANPASMPKH